ncbi:MAG: flagellar basal-body MS-ring/collar protein FliF [Myxococcales bacterium]
MVLLLVAAGAAAVVGGSEGYQYVFTNLTPEDSTEAAASLKTSGIPFRMEASGAALAVPASRVYEARMLLATAGLPRGGGVGFELFDRGDLGVSEFTQKVNLRRAIEGDLARTIGRLSEVRSARVHLTIPEKGLFRDEERKGSAAVVLNLHPGRAVGERELAGVRHLVASAVPGLSPTSVTIVDGKGAVLSGEGAGEDASRAFERRLERDLEARVVGLLEPVVGAGAVVARVAAQVDNAEVDVQQEAWDGDGAALRSERKISQAQSQDSSNQRGVAGAAANQPMVGTAPAGSSGSRGNSSLEDETRNFEIGKTTTHTLSRTPRLKSLSVAILLDGADGKPREAEEVARLGELAKKAVGLDTARGDQFEISSAVFAKAGDPAPASEPAAGFTPKPWHYAVGAGALLALLAAVFLLRSRSAPAAAHPVELLPPGAKVADLLAGRVGPAAAAAATAPQVGGADAPSLPPAKPQSLPDMARELAAKDPARAAHLLRAWMEKELSAELRT